MHIKEIIKEEFYNTFSNLKDEIEIMDLMEHCKFGGLEIRDLKLPSIEYDIVWHPGVYMFIGNNSLYRVGVSMENSRKRVLQHLEDWTNNGTHSIWDIDNYEDKSVLLFNVKNIDKKYWLLAIEAFFEMNFSPLIKAKRIG
jgi:hypothetical protein